MAAVPTMLAGVHGMNFEHMPELHRVWFYPGLIAFMAASEVLLLRLFKR
jgi:magnesium transporter